MSAALRAAAEAAKENYSWREPWEKVRRDFEEQATPGVVLGLLDEVAKLKRQVLELQRVYDELGLQISRLETAVQRGRAK